MRTHTRARTLSLSLSQHTAWGVCEDVFPVARGDNPELVLDQKLFVPRLVNKARHGGEGGVPVCDGAIPIVSNVGAEGVADPGLEAVETELREERVLGSRGDAACRARGGVVRVVGGPHPGHVCAVVGNRGLEWLACHSIACFCGSMWGVSVSACWCGYERVLVWGVDEVLEVVEHEGA